MNDFNAHSQIFQLFSFEKKETMNGLLAFLYIKNLKSLIKYFIISHKIISNNSQP